MTSAPAAPVVDQAGGPGLSVSAACLLCCAAFAWVFWQTPADAELGIVQKVFYIHVAAAFAMLLCLSAAAAAAVIDLAARSAPIDAAGRACTEVGLVFALVVLTSGPLWARKSWGAWWTWEPRLTLTLLLTFLALAVVQVRASMGESGRKIANALVVLAAPTAYLIHIAVQRWGGTHPQVLQGGGVQTASMRIAFWGCVAALLALAAALVAWRTAQLQLSRRLAALELDFLLLPSAANAQGGRAEEQADAAP